MKFEKSILARPLYLFLLSFFIVSCAASVDGPPTSLDQHISMVFDEKLQSLPQQTSDRFREQKDKVLPCAQKKLIEFFDMEKVNSIYSLLKKYKVEELDATNSYLFIGMNTQVSGAIIDCLTETGVSLF